MSDNRKNPLVETLVKRDNMTVSEAVGLIKDARDHMCEYDDPEDFMADWFGLELDYFIYTI